jgi:putative Holliday junction resolvase
VTGASDNAAGPDRETGSQGNGESSTPPPHSPTPLPSATRAVPSKGTLLGIDYGTVRHGLAVTDPDRIIASPLDTYARRSEALDGPHLARVAAEQRAVGIVVGLPIHANGQESDSSRAARAFGAWLGGVTGLPVVFWDERYTTWFAEGALLGAKLTHKKRKEKRDRVAAQMILQSYIEAGCPPGGTRAAEPDETHAG